MSGKLRIIKTFLISQCVYVLQTLSAPTKVTDRFNTIDLLPVFVEEEIFKQKSI